MLTFTQFLDGNIVNSMMLHTRRFRSYLEKKKRLQRYDNSQELLQSFSRTLRNVLYKYLDV